MQIRSEIIESWAKFSQAILGFRLWLENNKILLYRPDQTYSFFNLTYDVNDLWYSI